MKKIVIGTRGSQLALIQTQIVKKLLEEIVPKVQIEIATITTTGDKNLNPVPLDSVGKGWFTKEIDKALLNGTIDVAVHSLKDLPEILPRGLVIAAIPEREDAREALVTKGKIRFAKLKKGARIGTDSNRRRAQILHVRPDLIVESVRGNVNTRLEKLDRGEYDGLFLAVAGLKRLGFTDRISEYFPVTKMVPSPGQGALAVVVKESNKKIHSLLKKLNHEPSLRAISAERVFSKAVGGGCKLPVGLYAECKNDSIVMHGVIGSVDGKHLVKDSISGACSESTKLAQFLANKMLMESKPWYETSEEGKSSQGKKYIVITRPVHQSKEFQEKLENLGINVLSCPTIAIRKTNLTTEIKESMSHLNAFDWILFTSKNGVIYFFDALKKMHIDISSLSAKKFGAVGSKTADEMKKFGVSANVVPSTFTTEQLAKVLKNVKGKRILLPRANIANPLLKNTLEKKGAFVTNISIYKTTYVSRLDQDFQNLIKSGSIAALTFTSPSTVEGFLNNIKEIKNVSKIYALPVFSIGPVTTKTLKKYGFTHITTAEIFTIEDLVEKIKETIHI